MYMMNGLIIVLHSMKRREQCEINTHPVTFQIITTCTMTLIGPLITLLALP
jgi:hypothetical protein